MYGNVNTQNSYTTLSMTDLRVGTTLKSPIFDVREDRDVLLLAAGSTVTRARLNRLLSRGIREVRVAESAVAELVDQKPSHESDSSETTDDTLHREYRSDAFIRTIAQAKGQYDQNQKNEFELSYQDLLRQVENVFVAVESGTSDDAVSVAESTSQALANIAQDLDMFVSLGLEPEHEYSLCRHSLQTTILAMSVGTVSGLTQAELVDLGIGCLVHDVGMTRISPQLLYARRPLTQMEFLEITKHPTVTLDMVQSVPSVSSGARMVAYQMHERCDGSGYPRQRAARQIHPLAKIAAVADAYLALVSDRPYRSGRLPHEAMETLLRETRRGLYDPQAVRALLETVSLLPIGSFVKLSDGRTARVLRSNRNDYTRPLVEAWDNKQLGCTPELVDLAKEAEVTIVEQLQPIKSLTNSAAVAEKYVHDFWD